MIALLVGCSKEVGVDITEETMERGDLYSRTFTSWSSKISNTQYYIEKTDTITEEKAKEIIEKLVDDQEKISKIAKLKGLDNTVYVVEKNILNNENQPMEEFDNKMIIKLEEYEENIYYGEYIYLLTEQKERWQAYGLATKLEGGEINSIPEEELKKVFSDSEMMGILHLSDIRFVRNVPMQRVDLSIIAAQSYYKYLDTEKKEDSVEAKNSWLESIGASCKYDVSKEEETIYRTMKVSGNLRTPESLLRDRVELSDCNLIVDTTQADYNIVVKDNENAIFNSPDNIEQYILENELGINRVKKYFEDNECANILDLDQKIHYYDIGYVTDSTAVTDGELNEVFLADPIGVEFGMLHEAVHALTIDSVNLDNTKDCAEYLGEGIAEYINELCIVSDKYGLYSERMDKNQYARNRIDEKTITLKGDAEDIDYRIYASWFEYMAKKYSLKTMIEVIQKNGDLEGVIGITFEQSQKDWMKSLLNM